MRDKLLAVPDLSDTHVAETRRLGRDPKRYSALDGCSDGFFSGFSGWGRDFVSALSCQLEVGLGVEEVSHEAVGVHAVKVAFTGSTVKGIFTDLSGQA